MRYCRSCEKQVQPKKKFNWIACILLLGIFYVPFYWMKPNNICPICGCKTFKTPETK